MAGATHLAAGHSFLAIASNGYIVRGKPDTASGGSGNEVPSLGEQLSQAHSHVKQAKQRVTDQTGLIVRLTADGHDPLPAQRLLGTFLDVLDTLTEHLATLESKPPS